jgi:hypothetical protein
LEILLVGGLGIKIIVYLTIKYFMFVQDLYIFISIKKSQLSIGADVKKKYREPFRLNLTS